MSIAADEQRDPERNKDHAPSGFVKSLREGDQSGNGDQIDHDQRYDCDRGKAGLNSYQQYHMPDHSNEMCQHHQGARKKQVPHGIGFS